MPEVQNNNENNDIYITPTSADAEVLVSGTNLSFAYIVQNTENDNAPVITDLKIKGGAVKQAIADNEPMQGLHAGDLYLDVTSVKDENCRLIVPVSCLVDTYVQGEGITIDGKTVNINTNVVALKSDLSQFVTQADMSSYVNAEYVQQELETLLTTIGGQYVSKNQIATVQTAGIVKPDGKSVVVQSDGTLSVIGRNIGEIVASTIPLTDAGLHLLDGALISGSGSYSAFVDYIADLYDSGNYTDIFDTEANWQSVVTTYGVCGKFVYDSVNNTVRLPKYGNQIFTTNNISTATTLPVKGDGLTLGLTNGVINVGLNRVTGSTDYALLLGPSTGQYGINYSNTQQTFASGSTALGGYGVTTDSTKSGIVTDITSLTNQYGLDVYYYIVIATLTKTDIQVDIDEIATDLNGKADTDLSNSTPAQSFKNSCITWGTPDYANGITVAASSANEQTYTAPTAGFFNFNLWSQGSTYAYVKVNDTYALYGDNYGTSSSTYINFTGSIQVDKNDVIKFKTSKQISTWGNNNYFFPVKGGN